MSLDRDGVVIADRRCRVLLHPPDEPLSSSGFGHRVELFAGPFRGDFKAIAFTNVYAAFHDDLRSLYKTLSGQVQLFGYDNLDMKLVGDGRGHIDVVIIATADHYRPIAMTLRIILDQTQLPDLVAAVKRTFVPTATCSDDPR